VEADLVGPENSEKSCGNLDVYDCGSPTGRVGIKNNYCQPGDTMGLSDWFVRLFAGKEVSGMLDQANSMKANVDAQNDVRTNGTPAQASVLSIADTGGFSHGQPIVQLTLQVSAEGQADFTTSAQCVVPLTGIPRVGDQLNIRYDSQNPSIVAVL
jgi:hypothetical protein